VSGEQPVIAAEILPVTSNTATAARALQRIGFRVYSVGETISVEADEALWTAVFQVCFGDSQSGAGDSIHTDNTFRKAVAGTLTIPPHLQDLIEEVAFIEPPELF